MWLPENLKFPLFVLNSALLDAQQTQACDLLGQFPCFGMLLLTLPACKCPLHSNTTASLTLPSGTEQVPSILPVTPYTHSLEVYQIAARCHLFTVWFPTD